MSESGTATRGSRFIALLAAILVAVGLTALTTSAVAGSGSGANAPKKKKKKRCKAGTHKVTVKKKNGKKKKKCVADTPVTPPAGPTTLAISPATFTFPTTQHGDQSDPKAFTVTNTGGAPSGIPAPAITEVNNPIPGDPPGFAISANTCVAVLAPGGTCTVSVRFQPTSNANPQPYTSVLHVTATPGTDAQSALSGTAD
jgi:hypothetical protein